MIMDVLLGMASAVIDWAMSLVPSWSCSLPAGVQSVVATAKAYDAYVPVSECLEVVTVAVGMVMAMQGWRWTVKVVDWIMDVIP